MTRSKSNINVKMKVQDKENSGRVIESSLPTITQIEYAYSRVFVCDEQYIRRILNNDLE